MHPVVLEYAVSLLKPSQHNYIKVSAKSVICSSRIEVSLKIHFLHSHLDFFPQNHEAVSDKYGEFFFMENVAVMEKRYQGYWSVKLLSDYCWCLIRNMPEGNYIRKSSIEICLK
jgi:hypothetical protein